MAAKSVFRQHPSWVKHYGSLLWLDPGVPAARRYVIHVIMDVVHRYDVDGIHLDDYFYPYPKRDKQGKVIPFPDGASWRAYLAQGGTLDRAAWRRSNIDKFVQRLYAAVKYTKPQVLVGISPFGIWKPGHPPQIHGFNQMSQIYANPRLWLRRGWVDYLTPQLYWPIARPQQSYTALLRWWQQQNVRGRHLWPGLAAWRAVKDTGTFTPKEIQYQVEWTRIIERKDPGEVMFSAQAFRHANSPLAKRLRATVYRRAALVPASPWLSNGRPRPCAVRVSAVKGDTVTVQVKHATVPKDGWWVVQMRSGGQWSYRIAGAAQRSMKLALHGKQMQVQRLVAFAVNRLGVASRKVAVRHVR